MRFGWGGSILFDVTHLITIIICLIYLRGLIGVECLLLLAIQNATIQLMVVTNSVPSLDYYLLSIDVAFLFLAVIDSSTCSRIHKPDDY